MINTEIEWGYNCLTAGIHHGRPETIWNIPLVYAATVLFRKDELKEIVIARIYNDAMQYVEHWSEEDPELSNVTHRFAPEWADRVKEIAEERYSNTLQQKVGEITNYYETHGWRRDVHGVIAQLHQDRLNRGYKPLHDHDTINLLCRIIGSGASRTASKEFSSE